MKQSGRIILNWRFNIPTRSIGGWREAIVVDLPSLCIWRILYGLYALLFGPSYGWLGEVPNSFFAPSILSVASLFSHLPSAWFFQTLDVVILVLIIMVTLGFYTRASTLLLFFALVTGNHFYYALGKIDHSILFVIVLLIMAFADWGRYFSVDSLMTRPAKPESSTAGMQDLSIFALLIAFGFFTAGFGKAVAWLDFDPNQSGFLAWLFPGYFNTGHHYLLAPLAIQLRPTWLWEFADIVAVVFELGFLVALLRRRWWMFWLIAAAFFHLLNCLLLNIPFLAHAILYLCFVPWLEIFPRLRGISKQPRKFLTITAVCCLLLASVRLQNLDNYRSVYQLLTGFDPQSLGFLITACAIWGMTALILLTATIRTAQSGSDHRNAS